MASSEALYNESTDPLEEKFAEVEHRLDRRTTTTDVASNAEQAMQILQPWWNANGDEQVHVSQQDVINEFIDDEDMTTLENTCLHAWRMNPRHLDAISNLESKLR